MPCANFSGCAQQLHEHGIQVFSLICLFFSLILHVVAVDLYDIHAITGSCYCWRFWGVPGGHAGRILTNNSQLTINEIKSNVFTNGMIFSTSLEERERSTRPSGSRSFFSLPPLVTMSQVGGMDRLFNFIVFFLSKVRNLYSRHCPVMSVGADNALLSLPMLPLLLCKKEVWWSL